MIVPMRKVYLIARQTDREQLLAILRELGIVHLVPVDPAVAVPGEEPKRFDLKTASPEVRATTWLGFVSIGPPGAVFYLDNLRLSNSSD